MAPKTSKRAPKALAGPAIPPPFSPAPIELLPLLSVFEKQAVYITHIDAHPAWFKQRVFLVPVGLNLSIGLFLAWRAYVQLPWYWALTMSLLGNENHTTIMFSQLSWASLILQVALRSLNFLVDWLLYVVVGPWPMSFFFDSPGSPVSWRWKIGFRDEEIYVRESRGWGALELLGEAEGSTGKAGQDSPYFNTRVLPAVDAKTLREKTGYMLMGKDFDLYFAGMIKATELVDKKDISTDSLRKSVFVWVGSEETGQWTMWDCWRLDEGSEKDARKKIIVFKDRLTAMGKESLFFKWVELIQYESNAPGGFTQERQEATAVKAKKLFEDNGVDFDKFEKEIGGLDGMPGME
jgi:hypothetical protein